VDVAGKYGRALRGAPAQHGKEFAVLLAAGVEQKEAGIASCGIDGIDVKLPGCVALLVSKAEKQIAM
jgi:hypothetical protein